MVYIGTAGTEILIPFWITVRLPNPITGRRALIINKWYSKRSIDIVYIIIITVIAKENRKDIQPTIK
jgi:predicted signal transduction protein with EAL and GGDEF domain